VIDALLKAYWNRVFTPESTDDVFWPFWYWYDSPVLSSLPEHEQQKLREIIRKNEQSQEELWARTGRKLLKMMADETDMLVCAEDLGVIPDCVPQVLSELGILGLRIERWSRKWEEEGQPFLEPAEYPRLSVCSSSCHDSSTLAGWWTEEEQTPHQYGSLLGLHWTLSSKLTSELTQAILRRLASSNSLLLIVPLQDFLYLEENFIPKSPDSDRINVPGTLDAGNWTWRMKHNVSELEKMTHLSEQINAICTERKERPLWSI
jgi:4-alpha-glucanotransferase